MRKEMEGEVGWTDGQLDRQTKKIIKNKVAAR